MRWGCLRVAPSVGVTFLACLIAWPVSTAAYPSQRPNLKPLPPFDLRVGLPDRLDQGERALRFSVATMNLGTHPLELLGVPHSVHDVEARQCVEWMMEVCVSHEPVGAMVLHESHGHWHYEDFARYELRTVTNGKVDMDAGGLVAGGEKASFCLRDDEYADEQSAARTQRRYIGCLSLLQGISAGWQDVYAHFLSGQQIPIDSVPDDEYGLVVYVNTDGSLQESNYSDNMATRRLRLVDGGTRVIALEDDEPIIP